MKLLFSFLIGILSTFQLLIAEDSIELVKYSPDFEFKEGVYLVFDQVKKNSPLPKSRIITTVDYTDENFFDQVLSNKLLMYFDENAVKREYPMNKIWGYSRNGILYIFMNNDFYRITIVGRIAHFVANYTYYVPGAYSGYNYGYGYDPLYNSYNQPNTETRQYLLDFDNGRLYDYTVQNLEILLMKDPELYDEYSSLRNKKKKQLKFLYIRKFNEKNPLYFPKQ